LAGSLEREGDAESLLQLERHYAPQVYSWVCCGQQGEVHWDAHISTESVHQKHPEMLRGQRLMLIHDNIVALYHCLLSNYFLSIIPWCSPTCS